jgi:hypothetical protein
MADMWSWMVFVRGEKGKIMAEMISKWEVVGNLIALENEYQIHKEEWDVQTLYRKICKLEMAIGKRTALEVVRCKDCKHRYIAESGVIFCTQHLTMSANDNDFCSYGERKDDD